MAIINSIENIVVKSGKDFKRNEMQDMFTPRARMMDQNLAVMSSLQERAIRNENAYNEMAIKMSEYNAVQGVDEEALAGKIDETQNAIKEKVDEDGGWFFADTAVSDGARRFLTDEGVKTILSNKAQFDALMQANEQSDAPEEYKAANRAMILERFNNAGGSLGGNGKQFISAFGTALGKGHDRSVYEKELLEYMKAWKADKRSVFNAKFINDITELMNIPGKPADVQATIQKIIADRGGNLSAMMTSDTTIESVSEDEIRNVFSAILSNRPEFRTAMVKEAEINKWLNEKQGGDNATLVKDMLNQSVASNPKAQQAMLMASSFSDLTKNQQQAAMKDPVIMSRYLKEGLDKALNDLNQQEGESDIDYQTRMSNRYNQMYLESNVDSLLNLAKIGAYTSVETKTDMKYFDNLLLDNLKAKRDQLEKIKGEMTEAIGFSRANLPANAMMQIMDSNIKNANEAISNAKAVMAKYADATDDQGKYLYQQAEKSLIDAENVIKQNDAMLNSIFNQFDLSKPEDVYSINEAVDDLLDVKGMLSDKTINKNIKDKVKSAETINDKIDVITDALYANYLDNDEGHLFIGFDFVSEHTPMGFKSSIDPKDKIRSIVKQRFLSTAKAKGYEPQTIPITLFTPISNNKAEFSNALDGIGRLFADNIGIWNVAMGSLGTDSSKAKFLEDVIGMPITASSDFADVFGSIKSGSGNKALYQPSAKDLSIGSDATGRLYLKVTIPPQGDIVVPREVILYTDDDGANMALKDAMRKGAQCSYNQAMTNPYDAYQRQTANEIMAFSGNIETLDADMSKIVNPQERNLNRFNVINDNRVANVSQAISEIIKDTRVSPRGNYYPLTSGSFKYNITKTPTGIYRVNVQMYDPVTNSYIDKPYNNHKTLDFTFADDDALRRNLPALVYKLNHANELSDNFIPTKYLTPAQRSFYNVNYWNPDVLMLNR